MNIKLFRKVHLYLGCFFTPILIIFITTGLLQTFELHEKHKKNAYVPPAIVKALAEVHKHQRFTTENTQPQSSKVFQWFVVMMCLGLFVNIALGIVLAFKFADPKVVLIVVGLGIVIPVIILSMPWWHTTF